MSGHCRVGKFIAYCDIIRASTWILPGTNAFLHFTSLKHFQPTFISLFLQWLATDMRNALLQSGFLPKRHQACLYGREYLHEKLKKKTTTNNLESTSLK